MRLPWLTLPLFLLLASCAATGAHHGATEPVHSSHAHASSKSDDDKVGKAGVDAKDDDRDDDEDDEDLPPEFGKASYYARKHDGLRAASGETYDEKKMTAAHRTLPFGTRVRVTNLANDKSVVVRINDRGPFRRGRVIDVSRAAARKLDFLREGVTRVRVEVVDRP